MKRLGIEIEFTGVKREEVVRALENLFQTESKAVTNTSTNSPYLSYEISDYYGNIWKIVRDRSIKSQVYCEESRFDVTDIVDPNFVYTCELVSPILNSSTLPTLFIIIEVIKAIGGVVNNSCGIHIHIDKPDIKSICLLFKKFINMQDEIFNTFSVQENRQSEYCKKFPSDINIPEFDSEKDFLDWYYKSFSVYEGDVPIIKTSRYYGINMYAIESHNTIEFRIFNSSLSSVDIAKYIKFVLNFCYEFDDICNYSIMLEGYLQRELEKGVL